MVGRTIWFIVDTYRLCSYTGDISEGTTIPWETMPFLMAQRRGSLTHGPRRNGRLCSRCQVLLLLLPLPHCYSFSFWNTFFYILLSRSFVVLSSMNSQNFLSSRTPRFLFIAALFRGVEGVTRGPQCLDDRPRLVATVSDRTCAFLIELYRRLSRITLRPKASRQEWNSMFCY